MKKTNASFNLFAKQIVVLIVLLCLTASCDPITLFTVPPLTPVNLTDANSIYDDYNSEGFDPLDYQSYFLFRLVFSSNRFSEGQNFDYVFYNVTGVDDGWYDTSYLEVWSDTSSMPLLDTVNSSANELGPYFTKLRDYEESYPDDIDTLYGISKNRRFFYTSDRNGSLDIFCRYYGYERDDVIPLGDQIYLHAINTDADEGYITLHPDENASAETIYFTSNREGRFDIYRAVGENNKSIDESDNVEITKMTVLSSEADDKCPYIKDNVMVFTSNRPGGSGGFDLYYSLYDGSSWSEPKNCGEEINSGSDEYRPVFLKSNIYSFSHNYMIFSSNRPGGKGGYDLYSVRLKSLRPYFE